MVLQLYDTFHCRILDVTVSFTSLFKKYVIIFFLSTTVLPIFSYNSATGTSFTMLLDPLAARVKSALFTLTTRKVD